LAFFTRPEHQKRLVVLRGFGVNKIQLNGFVQLIAFDRKEVNENSYEVLSGERPEYFIRVNSITRIEQIINDDYYQSEMVRLVRQRHEDAKKDDCFLY